MHDRVSHGQAIGQAGSPAAGGLQTRTRPTLLMPILRLCWASLSAVQRIIVRARTTVPSLLKITLFAPVRVLPPSSLIWTSRAVSFAASSRVLSLFLSTKLFQPSCQLAPTHPFVPGQTRTRRPRRIASTRAMASELRGKLEAQGKHVEGLDAQLAAQRAELAALHDEGAARDTKSAAEIERMFKLVATAHEKVKAKELECNQRLEAEQRMFSARPNASCSLRRRTLNATGQSRVTLSLR